jgi:hypothetical protein
VHREVDLALMQPAVEFLGPQRLAADIGQRALDPVGTGGDGDDGDRRLIPAMGGAKPCTHLMRLRHGQRRSTGAQTQGAIGVWHKGCGFRGLMRIDHGDLC